MIDEVAQQLEAYLDSLVPLRPDEMQSMEKIAQQTNFPIVGPASGQFCYMMARLVGARRIFELGSGYGYSTAWFARAVSDNGGGTVYHVVWDQDLSNRARAHLAKLNLSDLIEYRVAEAVQELRVTEGPFDLIFNDIEKHAYPESLPLIYEKLHPGGLLIVDNLLWHGRIFDANNHHSDTEGVREFTRMITTSPGWVTSLVPIRDGLMVAYKK